MPGHDTLEHLASLIGGRNEIEAKISAIIGRPAHSGHIGEFVASGIFDIELAESAAQKGIDGHFSSGPLAGKSVNIKKYSTDQGLLDIVLESPPDFYLVLTGLRIPPVSSRGTTQPWTIESVFLFDAASLVQQLRQRGVKIGVATSVRRHQWDEAEIYPSANNRALRLTSDQTSMIQMFSGSP